MQLLPIIVLALITGCVQGPGDVTPKELSEAQSICNTHKGVVKINMPKPIDVYCTDGLHVRVFDR